MFFVIFINHIIKITSGDNGVVLIFFVFIFVSIYFVDVIILMDINLTSVCLTFSDDSIKLLLLSILAILMSTISIVRVLFVSINTTFC